MWYRKNEFWEIKNLIDTNFFIIIATIFNAIILILPMVGVWGEVAKAPCLFTYTIIRDPGRASPKYVKCPKKTQCHKCQFRVRFTVFRWLKVTLALFMIELDKSLCFLINSFILKKFTFSHISTENNKSDSKLTFMTLSFLGHLTYLGDALVRAFLVI